MSLRIEDNTSRPEEVLKEPLSDKTAYIFVLI